MCVLFRCDKMFPALLSLSASNKSGRRRTKGRGRYSFWNHCQINSLCPALVCSFKHKDLFGTRVSGRSYREPTCPFPDVRWHFGRHKSEENKSGCEKKTTYAIRNFPGASSIDRRVTHQPGPLLAEQRAPVSCCCCCWSWWWWWTSCGLTAWRCKYLAEKDDRTIKTETNKVVKLFLLTWRFKGSLKKYRYNRLINKNNPPGVQLLMGFIIILFNIFVSENFH